MIIVTHKYKERRVLRSDSSGAGKQQSRAILRLDAVPSPSLPPSTAGDNLDCPPAHTGTHLVRSPSCRICRWTICNAKINAADAKLMLHTVKIYHTHRVDSLTSFSALCSHSLLLSRTFTQSCLLCSSFMLSFSRTEYKPDFRFIKSTFKLLWRMFVGLFCSLACWQELLHLSRSTSRRRCSSASSF